MADSFNKKEREKKRQKRKKEKAYRREQKKTEDNKPAEFMYVDEDGHLTTEAPDLTLKKKVTKVEDIEISTRKSEKSGESKYTKTGIVKFFNSEKGYGFIDTSENSESFFVHADNLNQEVKEGDHVTFEIGKGPKGPIATDVSIVAK